jgi:hypothetical protein
MQDRQLAKPPTDAPATAALPPERRELPCQSTHQLPRQPPAHAPPLAFRLNSWNAAENPSPVSSGCSVAAMARPGPQLFHQMDEKWAEFMDRSRAGWEKMLGVLATLL